MKIIYKIKYLIYVKHMHILELVNKIRNCRVNTNYLNEINYYSSNNFSINENAIDVEIPYYINKIMIFGLEIGGKKYLGFTNEAKNYLNDFIIKNNMWFNLETVADIIIKNIIE